MKSEGPAIQPILDPGHINFDKLSKRRTLPSVSIDRNDLENYYAIMKGDISNVDINILGQFVNARQALMMEIKMQIIIGIYTYKKINRSYGTYKTTIYYHPRQ